MALIVITPEKIRQDESSIISQMLLMGVNRVHLRHPGASEEELHNIICEIPLKHRQYLTIHDCFQLTEIFPQIGINLNRRNPNPPALVRGLLSRSCHSVDQTLLPADYCLLSPIFPSISKNGYHAEFSERDLMSLPPNKVIALGGINYERIEVLKRYPFTGVAVLGAVWNCDTNPADVINNVAKIIEKL